MTSTIKVNTIQNTCGADIIKESSNTITIGASGDTVTLYLEMDFSVIQQRVLLLVIYQQVQQVQ
jgi:hypothetical protein